MKYPLLVLLLLLAASIYCYELTIGSFVPKGVFCDDLDRDGDVDLLVIAQNFNVHILHNNGDGTYSNTMSLPVGKTKSFTQKLYDFNNDGWTDIDGFFATTDENGNTETTLRIYLNSAGVFNENAYIDLPPMPQMDRHWVFYGDWNGDAYTDVLVWDDDMYYLVLNNSGVSFTATGETIAGVGWGGFRDMDSDGTDELFLSTSEGLHVYKYPDLVSPFLVLPNSGYFRTVETEDLDRDGDLDIFISFCDGTTYSSICIYENIGNYNYLAHNNIYHDNRDLDGVLLRDVTNDQYLDVVNYAYVSPYNPVGFDYPFSLFYFLPISMPNYNIYSEYSGFDYIDVDNNGFLDFVLVWRQSGARLRVYYNDGMGNFSDNPVVSNEDELVPNPEIELSVYPNPFTEKVIIEYTPCTTGEMVLSIYNVKGQIVRSYHEVARANEPQHIQWAGNDEYGKNVSKGIYFCKINMPNNKPMVKKTIKM
jgi:hypothetical protein